MIKKWLLFNVGCIECGVSSAVVGLFSDKLKAEKIGALLDKHHGWREGGQNSYEIFDLTQPMADEYMEIIEKHELE